MMKPKVPFWVLGVLGDANTKPQFVKDTWNRHDYLPIFMSEESAIEFAELKHQGKQLFEIPNKGKAPNFGPLITCRHSTGSTSTTFAAI
jgi:hypothetical protein